MRRPSRTVQAALATAAALGLPCAAWFVAGSRAAQAEAARLEQSAMDEARAEADRLSRQIGARLDALTRNESRRSYLDYGLSASEATGTCECEPAPHSALAHGPTDPLVWTHFQIDQVGQISLPGHPTDPGWPAASTSEVSSAAAALSRSTVGRILDPLECAIVDRVASLRRPSNESAASRVEPGPLDSVVTVGPFHWHSITVEGEAALVALREVLTSGAMVAQGFVVRAGAVETLLEGSAIPARIAAESNAGPASRVPLEGVEWSVIVDPETRLATARSAGEAILGTFRRTFAGGILAALIAGGLVVGVVYQAERLARQRALFAAAAAHELRTPLAGLRLYCEMLTEPGVDGERRQRYAERAASEAERLGRVVTNVLAFSRLERDGLTVRPVHGDLGAAVREAVEWLEPCVTSAGARVEASIVPQLPEVVFDRDAVNQILQNLVDNAERYSRGAAERLIRVVVAPAAAGVAMSVIDRGPGLNAEPWRARGSGGNGSGGPASGGLGIGLKLVRALAQAQGAELTCGKAEGGGGRVTIVFPLDNPVPSATAT